MKKKILVVDIEQVKKPVGKPWGTMNRAEFLKAATDAIIAGRHASPPDSYISNGKRVEAKPRKGSK